MVAEEEVNLWDGRSTGQRKQRVGRGCSSEGEVVVLREEFPREESVAGTPPH